MYVPGCITVVIHGLSGIQSDLQNTVLAVKQLKFQVVQNSLVITLQYIYSYTESISILTYKWASGFLRPFF